MLWEPVILINRWVYKDLVRYALAQPRVEICGLLGGRFLSLQEALGLGISSAEERLVNRGYYASINEFYPIPNIAGDYAVDGVSFPSKESGFIAEPNTFNKAWSDILNKGNHVVGCYHSHPFWSGNPSTTDLKNARDDYFWLIYDGRRDSIQSWLYQKDINDFVETRLIIGSLTS